MLKQDAIQQDVSEERIAEEVRAEQDQHKKDEALRKFNDHRNEMMEIIAQRANQQFEPPQEEPKEEEEPESIEPVIEAVPQPSIEQPAEKMVTVTIDGKTQEVPESQILETGKRALQKELAADKRLEEASKLKREIEQLKQEILVRMPPAQQTGAHTVQPEVPQVDAVAKIPIWMQAIRYGTEEEANEAFKEALMATQPKQYPTLRPEDTIRMVRSELQTNAIVTKFDQAPPEQGGFSDIAKDPNLRMLSAREVDRLIAEEGMNPLDWATYERAGKTIREWRDSMMPKVVATTPVVATPQPDTFKEKVEKKKTIDSVPTASARTMTGDKVPEKEPTPSEIIAEMQKQRARIKTGVR